MSIVRVGMAENKKFAAGYEAIFGKKQHAKKKVTMSKGNVRARKKPVSKKK